MTRPLFSLGARLKLCADMVRPGCRLCDVGCDHAYLSIWLIRTGRAASALACDINEGPLKTAEKNAARYAVADKITLRLSDGLKEVRPYEADDIVIAGLGGEVILKIIEETEWLKDESKLLILQPMSSAMDLRMGLKSLGFGLLSEQATEDAGRPYTVITAGYSEKQPDEDILYPYIGRLSPGSAAAKRYAEKELKDMRLRLEGAMRGRGELSREGLAAAIAELEKRFSL